MHTKARSCAWKLHHFQPKAFSAGHTQEGVRSCKKDLEAISVQSLVRTACQWLSEVSGEMIPSPAAWDRQENILFGVGDRLIARQVRLVLLTIFRCLCMISCTLLSLRTHSL